MGFHRQREQRRIVFVKAQLRADGDWSEITICNISSRGLMGKCASPPAKGTYIELRHRSLCIVGRVVWLRIPTMPPTYSDLIAPTIPI